MSETLTREQRIYMALWRKAYRDYQTNPLVIQCSSFKMAMRQRLGLYRVIKPYRDGIKFDHELSEAAKVVVPTISPKGEEPITLTFRPRRDLADLEALISDLDLSDEDFLTQQEKEINQELLELAGPNRSTPFYTRD